MIDIDILRYAQRSSRDCNPVCVWGAASAASPSSATDATTNVHYLVLAVQPPLRIMVLVSDLMPILPVEFNVHILIKVIIS